MSLYPQKPEVAVGAVVIHEGKVLLVKRKRPPAKGLWAIPGGRIKLGETLKQAAERELFEETGIIIDAKQPIYTFDSINKNDAGKIKFHYVIVDLCAEYKGGELKAGDDAVEARWVSSSELDKIEINPSTKFLLEKYL
jgi:ADP-ribose pyrophosphatase